MRLWVTFHEVKPAPELGLFGVSERMVTRSFPLDIESGYLASISIADDELGEIMTYPLHWPIHPR